ncbi:MAG: hypothetical protein QNJ90_07615 [Planctomycetota bacterium]|nr:hypothetical protein [Planctomycetota bacterium]
MLDFLKKFGHVIAAIAIVYYGYSAIEAGGGGMENKQKPLRIPKSALWLRAAEEVLESEGDPFFREWSPYGPEYAPEAIAARKRAKQEAEDAARVKAREARIKQREGAAKKKAAAERASGASAFQPFDIELQSVLALSGGGVALISGRTVRVGEKVKGFDKKQPPVLVSVSGTSAVVEYRGQRIELDLRTKPVHRVKSLPGAPVVKADTEKPVETAQAVVPEGP